MASSPRNGVLGGLIAAVAGLALLTSFDILAGGGEPDSQSSGAKGAQPCETSPQDPKAAELMKEGEAIAKNLCATCHGPEGAGLVGPALRANVQYARGVVRAIVQGVGAMPPVAAGFSDREIAAVVTYVRNSWGNQYGAVTEQEVAEMRP